MLHRTLAAHSQGRAGSGGGGGGGAMVGRWRAVWRVWQRHAHTRAASSLPSPASPLASPPPLSPPQSPRGHARAWPHAAHDKVLRACIREAEEACKDPHGECPTGLMLTLGTRLAVGGGPHAAAQGLATLWSAVAHKTPAFVRSVASAATQTRNAALSRALVDHIANDDAQHGPLLPLVGEGLVGELVGVMCDARELASVRDCENVLRLLGPAPRPDARPRPHGPHGTAQDPGHARLVLAPAIASALLSWVAASDLAHHAVRLLSAVSHSPESARSTAATQILLLCCRQGLVRDVGQVRAHMLAQGQTLTPSVVTAVLNCYAKATAVDKAMAVLGHEDRTGSAYVPPPHTLSSLLVACASTRSHRHGTALHRRFLPPHSRLAVPAEPNVIVLTAVVNMYSKCGDLDGALGVVEDMRGVLHTPPTNATFVPIVALCAVRHDLEHGKRVHEMVRETGEGLDTRLGTALVGMYAKCGRVELAVGVVREMDAQGVAVAPHTITSLLDGCRAPEHLRFGEDLHRRLTPTDTSAADGGTSKAPVTPAIANALVDMYAKCDSAERAVQCVRDLEAAGTPPELPVAFACVLRKCGEENNLKLGQHVHRTMKQQGLGSSTRLANALLGMYAKCGALDQAMGVFRDMQSKRVPRSRRTFASLLAAFQDWHHAEPLRQVVADVLGELGQQQRPPPSSPSNQQQHQHQHQQQQQQQQQQPKDRDRSRGPVPADERLDTHTLNLAMRTCVKCGEHELAWAVYERMEGRERGTPCAPDSHSFSAVLSACARGEMLERGKQVHARICKDYRNHYSLFLGNCLVSMYCKCDDLDSALKVLQRLLQTNACPDRFTFACLVQACGRSSRTPVDVCSRLHAHITESVPMDVVLANSLVGMYAARGLVREAFCVLEQMDAGGVRADPTTFTTLFGLCASARAVRRGRRLHERVLRTRLRMDLPLWNSIVRMYASCAQPHAALVVYRDLVAAGVAPNLATFDSLVQACTLSCALGCAEEVQEEALARLGAPVVWRRLAVPVITMFSRCGSFSRACEAFECALRARQPSSNVGAGQGGGEEQGAQGDEGEGKGRADAPSPTNNADGDADLVGGTNGSSSSSSSGGEASIVVWNAMLSACAHHGRLPDALRIFERLRAEGGGAKPDHVTMLALLTACSRAGDAARAVQLLDDMERTHGVERTAAHLTCVVDALARAGDLDAAEKLAETMGSSAGSAKRGGGGGKLRPTATTWLTLLSACQRAGDVERAGRVAVHALQETPRSGSAYALLYSTLRDAGMGQQASGVVQVMREAGVRRRRPAASVETSEGIVRVARKRGWMRRFWRAVDDLKSLRLQAVKAGLWEGGEGGGQQQKGLSPTVHKIALLHGLAQQRDRNAVVCVRANVQLDPDDHKGLLVIAKLRARAFSLRDTRVWHHVSKDGRCSCGAA